MDPASPPNAHFCFVLRFAYVVLKNNFEPTPPKFFFLQEVPPTSIKPNGGALRPSYMYRGVPWVVLLRKTPTCLVLFIWGGVWGQLMGVSGRLGLPLGAPPIHTKPTQWPYGARKVLTCPPGWAGGPCRIYLWGHILESHFFSFPSFFDQERYAKSSL